MKAILFALTLLAVLSLPFAHAAEETAPPGLATFSISFEINGMEVNNLPPRAGDRILTFVMYFPSDSVEGANEIFYEHLRIILGEDEIKELKSMAQNVGQQRK